MREENPGKEFPTFTPAEHLADAIAWLCSDGAAEMNGPRLPLTMALMASGAEERDRRADGKMTIGELARRTGMTIRNIRAHQTRGLLPPPEVQGRTGYYNEEHVARIELTREMQAEGLNLEAIRRVLESTGGSSQEMVDFARAVRAPFEDETPEIFDAAEFAAELAGRDGRRGAAAAGRKARRPARAAGRQGRGDQPAPAPRRRRG